MISYANILQGIVRRDDERVHYYNLQLQMHGEFSLHELLEFINNPRKSGELMPRVASDLVGYYNLSGRKSKLQIYNLSAQPLKEFSTWERIVGNFDPVLEVNSGIVTRLGADPMNLSHDQLRMFSSICQNLLRKN